jgi:glycosyltransferase involved in cell wall biosynthesis
VEALRAAGVEAHFGYVGGYKLETKLQHLDYAHPVIERRQDPASFLRSATAIRRLVERLEIDVLHAHLTYDHWLARFAARRRPLRLARTFHSRRVLRADPFTRSLIAATPHLLVINEAFLDAPLLRKRSAVFTPPPLDRRLFHPDGPNVREAYGIDAATPLLCAIGKVAPERGFEDVLRTFAIVRESLPAARLMIIGHGPHRPFLEQLAASLGVAESTLWAGYHEDDLPEHFRAADLMLFTAKGSDEGHRAVQEAMGCGTPVASMPIEGIAALYRGLPARFVAGEPSPRSLAERALDLLSTRGPEQRAQVSATMQSFEFDAATRRLLRGYGQMT